LLMLLGCYRCCYGGSVLGSYSALVLWCYALVCYGAMVRAGCA
jgi:hypothetical protein